MDHTEEIKKLIKTDKAVIGTDRTLKLLGQGKIGTVYVTKNCPQEISKEVLKMAKLSGTAVEQLELDNDELGVICRKPFSISLVSVLK